MLGCVAMLWDVSHVGCGELLLTASCLGGSAVGWTTVGELMAGRTGLLRMIHSEGRMSRCGERERSRERKISFLAEVFHF